MKKRFAIHLICAAVTAGILGGCTSDPQDSIFDPYSASVVFEPTEDSYYEEEFHPEDWIEYDEEGEPILPDGVDKSDVFDDAGNFIGDPSMFGFVSGGGGNSENPRGGSSGGQQTGQYGGTDNGGTEYYTEDSDGSAGSDGSAFSEEGWNESSDGEDDGEWAEDSDDDGDDDSWVEDSDDGGDEDDGDDGVELWNGTGEWNGY